MIRWMPIALAAFALTGTPAQAVEGGALAQAGPAPGAQEHGHDQGAPAQGGMPEMGTMMRD